VHPHPQEEATVILAIVLLDLVIFAVGFVTGWLIRDYMHRFDTEVEHSVQCERARLKALRDATGR
jgi:uncharacterized membrane protein YciS (DUF1049 family)